jgi:subtilisin family serine protease
MRRMAIAVLTAACASTAAGMGAHAPPKQLHPGQIIVALALDWGDDLAAIRRQLAIEYGVVEVGNFILGSVELECVVFEAAREAALPELVDRLNRDRRVKLAEVNQAFRGEGAGGERSRLSYGAAQTHADAARRSKTGKGVRVAVIDTGVSTTHPALRDRIAFAQNFVESGEASFGRDLHGTAVAGVIAARRDDPADIFGIAPDAEILALKACWYAASGDAKASCSSWTLAKAIDFAVGAGAQVLNMSLSGPEDELLRRLIDKAQQRGAIVVAALPEGTSNDGFPASVAGVIAVAASDSRGEARLPASKSARFVVVAPGVDILTTVPGEAYDFVSGSSFAAAHVSGVVALLREEDPRLTGRTALEVLEATARPLPGGGHAGLLDACAALGRLMGTATCP